MPALTAYMLQCPACSREAKIDRIRKYDKTKERTRPGRIKDLTGERAGFIVVEEATEKRLHSSVVWRCRCDCGKTVMLSSIMLTRYINGKTQKLRSCGCTRKHKGVYERKCSKCGTWYEVRPGELGNVCEDCMWGEIL